MGIKVNMTQAVASSEGFEPIPSGKYKVSVTECTIKESKSKKNKGKPYYNMELTVQDGNYEGKKVFTNVMLWAEAGYSLAQILKAVGAKFDGADFIVDGHEMNEVPEADWWYGQEFLVRVTVLPERTVTDEETGEKKTYDKSNEVKGFYPIKKNTEAGVETVSDLMP